MNEFDKTSELNDLEFLKSFRPEWENERIEPLTPNPQDNVIPPTWNKVQLDSNSSDSNTSGAQLSPGSDRVIVAWYDGSTWVPKVMLPLDGTLFEDP